MENLEEVWKFNLDKEVSNKVHSIELHNKLEININEKVNIEKSPQSTHYLNLINKNNQELTRLNNIIKINNYIKIKNEEIKKNINEKLISINIEKKKYSNYSFNNQSETNIEKISFSDNYLYSFYLDKSNLIQNFQFINTLFINNIL